MSASNKRRRPDGATGSLAKSISTAATMADEIKDLIITYEKLNENTENQAKGIQKLNDTLEVGFSKILGISEAKVTKIQSKDEDSFRCKMQELQVPTTCFTKGITVGNTTSRGDTGIDTLMNELVIAYQELSEKSENQAIQIQRLNEKLEGVFDQTARKHEDLVRMSEGKKIRTKKDWSGKADLCTVKDLELLTDNFSDENLIGDTSYGKLYRGKLKLDPTGSTTKDVVVKIWDEKVEIIDDGQVVKEEVKFLALNFCQNRSLPKLISFCNHGYYDPELKNGVVYDVNPLGRLSDYIPKDDFSWIHRLKVAYKLAKLLKHLSIPDSPYVLYDLDSGNILLNQEYCPVVVDFGLLFGGLKGGQRYKQEFAEMSVGYYDPYYDYAGKRSVATDVHSFGINLLALLAKRTDKNIEIKGEEYKNKLLKQWACRVYTGDRCSLVHDSLSEDDDYEESDGIALTKLAMNCIQLIPGKSPERPSIYEVVGSFRKLHIFKRVEAMRS